MLDFQNLIESCYRMTVLLEENKSVLSNKDVLLEYSLRRGSLASLLVEQSQEQEVEGAIDDAFQQRIARVESEAGELTQAYNKIEAEINKYSSQVLGNLHNSAPFNAAFREYISFTRKVQGLKSKKNLSTNFELQPCNKA